MNHKHRQLTISKEPKSERQSSEVILVERKQLNTKYFATKTFKIEIVFKITFLTVKNELKLRNYLSYEIWKV